MVDYPFALKVDTSEPTLNPLDRERFGMERKVGGGDSSVGVPSERTSLDEKGSPNDIQ